MERIIVNSELNDSESYGFQSLTNTKTIGTEDCIFCDGTTIMWDNTPCVCLEYEESLYLSEFDM